jgi:hypothetical protein
VRLRLRFSLGRSTHVNRPLRSPGGPAYCEPAPHNISPGSRPLGSERMLQPMYADPGVLPQSRPYPGRPCLRCHLALGGRKSLHAVCSSGVLECINAGSGSEARPIHDSLFLVRPHAASTTLADKARRGRPNRAAMQRLCPQVRMQIVNM